VQKIHELNVKNNNHDSFVIDWLQANWELFIEGSFSSEAIRVEIYGEGADINGSSSRVTFPNDIPTASVKCIWSDVIEDKLTHKMVKFKEPILFEKFVTVKDGWYYEDCPFDAVLVQIEGKETIFDLKDVSFVLVKY
jgi:hypothetical protein